MADVHCYEYAGAKERPQVVREGDDLVSEIRDVREKIVAAVSEADEIRLQVIPNIRTEYQIKIGCWEKEVLAAELRCRRARRKLALVQARLNEGLAPQGEAELEHLLDEELESWEARVAYASKRYLEAAERHIKGQVLTPADARELKACFRTLAKRLHPDLHPGQSPERLRLFMVAKEAYAKGDVNALRSLEVATREYDEQEEDLDALSPEELASALELAQIELAAARSVVDELKASPDYQLGRRLTDASWVVRTVTQLQDKVRQFDATTHDYAERLARLRGGFHE